MIRKTRLLLILFLIGIPFTGSPNKLFASFEDTGTGARATALGGAFTSLANDVHALYYNPSGLMYLRRKEFAATYGLLQTGLVDKSNVSDSYVAYGQPLNGNLGTLGFSWQQTSLDTLYSERTLTLGYGKRISERWAMGLNIKQLHRQFTVPTGQTSNSAVTETEKSDPLFSGGSSKSNLAFDLGVLFCPYRKFSYGLMVQNLNEPNMAIAENQSDPVNMALRSGVTYRQNNLTLVSELNTKKSLGSRRDFLGTFAVEKWWVGAGFTQGDLAARGSLAVGSRSFSQVTVGLSYRLNVMQVDYGFLMPLGGITFGSSMGSHRMSLTLRFGKTQADPEYALRERTAEISAKKAEGELKQLEKESKKMDRNMDELKNKFEENELGIDLSLKSLGKEEMKVRFEQALDGYWRRKSQEAMVDERISILSEILKNFSGSQIDLSKVEQELAVAKSDRAKAEVDLGMEWNYYQQMVANGASIPERVQILSETILKFARTGADLTTILEELKALREK